MSLKSFNKVTNNLSSRYDFHTDEQTKRRMRQVRTSNTVIEQKVEHILRSLDIDFKMRDKSILGRPDFILWEYDTVIFVNGCYWHGHNCRKGKIKPKRNSAYWENKIEKNRIRDAKIIEALNEQGWHCITLWECELKNKDLEECRKRLQENLKNPCLNRD